MHITKQHHQNLTEGVIWKALIGFAVPLLLGNLLQQFYGMVDSIIVGNLVGKEALAAVSSTVSVQNTLLGLVMGISIGCSVVISQYYGANDERNLSRAVHTSIILTLILGLVFSVGGFFLTPFLVRVTKTPADVVKDATTYLSIYFGGMFTLIIYNMTSGILRAVGDSIRPLIFLAITSFLNIILDIFFIAVLKMGVDGAAYATILSQFISGLCALAVLFSTKENYGLRINKFCFDLKIVSKIIIIGLPTGLQRALTAFSNTIVLSYINGFGSASMAGWGIYSRIHPMVTLPMESIGMASTTFTGQNWGAKNIERIKKGVNTSILLTASITIVLSALTCLFSVQLTRAFTKDVDVMFFSKIFIFTQVPLFFISSGNRIYASAMRGLGSSTVPMIIMLLCFVGFRQVYLIVGTHFLGPNIYYIAFAYPVGWALCSLIIRSAYKKTLAKKIASL